MITSVLACLSARECCLWRGKEKTTFCRLGFDIVLSFYISLRQDIVKTVYTGKSDVFSTAFDGPVVVSGARDGESSLIPLEMYVYFCPHAGRIRFLDLRSPSSASARHCDANIQMPSSICWLKLLRRTDNTQLIASAMDGTVAFMDIVLCLHARVSRRLGGAG